MKEAYLHNNTQTKVLISEWKHLYWSTCRSSEVGRFLESFVFKETPVSFVYLFQQLWYNKVVCSINKRKIVDAFLRKQLSSFYLHLPEKLWRRWFKNYFKYNLPSRIYTLNSPVGSYGGFVDRFGSKIRSPKKVFYARSMDTNFIEWIHLQRQ